MSQLNPTTFPLTGSRLIEASAGTGKTFTISLLYLRLVLGHRAPDNRNARALTPPEILVSTFTEAAVAELRDRIRDRLQQAARLFSGNLTADEVDEPLRQLHAEFDAAERRHGGFLLHRAAEWMDEAAIFTIHGFCQRMLREHAFNSRALFEQELITDIDPVVSEAIRDFWRIHGYALAADDPQQATRFADIIDPPTRLKGKIRTLISRDDSPLAIGEHSYHHSSELPSPEQLLSPLRDAGRALDNAEQVARASWRKHQDALHTLWLELREGLNGNSHREAKTEDGFRQWLAGVDAWATGEADLDDRVLAKLVEPKLKKGWTPPEHPVFAALHELREARGALKAGTDAIRPQLQAFAALWIRERVADLLDQRRAMGFEDMLLQMRRAVDPERNPTADAMIGAIRQQYPVALIDEFQDTDPLQYGIFSAIYPLGADSDENDETAIVLIGDPKQAIYSFRGADIHSYLTARRATEGRHATLLRNFRSTQAMVDAVNRVFTLADKQPGGAFRFPDDGTHNPVPFAAVDANGRDDRLLDRREAEERELPALTVWTTPAEEEWTATDFTEELARRSAGEISDLLNAGQSGECGFAPSDDNAGIATGIQPRDIAVLVRSGDQGQMMRQALAAFGVPAVFLSEKSSIFQSSEAADMLIWLQALAEPGRSARIRLALSTLSVALPLAELEAMLRDETAFDEICNAFHDWHLVWRAQGVLAAIMRLLHHFSIPARLLAPVEGGSSGGLSSGERRLTNLLHLAEWLQQVDHDVDGEAAVIQRLHLAVTEGEGEQEIRLEQDSDMVRIVTIHSAKGLQYPVVFLPFAALIGRDNSSQAKSGRSRSNGPAAPTRRHRHGRNVWDMLPDEHATDRAERESISEEIRLLYVALTRAEYACYLCAGPVRIQTKEFNPGKTAFGQFLGFQPGATCDASEFQAVLSAWDKHPSIAVRGVPERRDPAGHRYQPPAPPPLNPSRQPRFAAFSPWQIGSFSAIKATAEAQAAPIANPWPETPREELRLEIGDEALAEPGAVEPSTGLTAASSGQLDLLSASAHGLHDLPRGAHVGTLLHDLLEMAADRGFDTIADMTAARALVDNSRHPGWQALPEAGRAVVANLIHDLLNQRWTLGNPTNGLRLRDLSQYQAEMEFWFASQQAPTAEIDRLIGQYIAPGRPRPVLADRHLNGMLKGFIDLTFAHEGRYYILDWKSNWLGPDDGAYTAEALTDAMLEARYELQYVLYLVALHRHLRDRLPDYDYDRHIGGALYIFLRGIHASDSHGLYFDRPPRTLIETLDRLFAGRTGDDVEAIA